MVFYAQSTIYGYLRALYQSNVRKMDERNYNQDVRFVIINAFINSLHEILTALFLLLSCVFSGLGVLCIVPRRPVYPCRYGDLCPCFHRPKKEICLLFNVGVHFIFDNWSAHFTDFNHPWLTVPSVVRYCEAVRAKGRPLPS